MFKWYQNSPKARALVRAVVVGVIAYLVGVFKDGGSDWKTVLWGIGGAVVYAIAGALTPLEPLVGVKTQIKVPADTTQTQPIS